MQPIFYHSSPNEAVAPAKAPVPIHAGAASPIPVARPSAEHGTLRVLANTERNSRVAYRVKPLAEHAAWQIDLPAHFAPEAVLAGGGHAVVVGPDGWLLLDHAGRTLGQDRGGPGEVTLDPAHGVFYTPGSTGYVEARSLADGRREFFLTAYFGKTYQRTLIERRDRRMLIVSIELPSDPHGNVEPHTSVIELQDLGEPFEFSDVGRLKSAKRLDYLMATTTHLLPAVHDDVVAVAVDDSIYLMDFNVKLERQLTGQFHPLFLSLDETPRLYLLAEVASGVELWVVTLAGERVIRTVLPEGFEPIAPPVIGLDHSVFLTSRSRVLAIDPSGAIRWEHLPGAGIAGAVVTSEGNLLVSAGQELVSYDRAGKSTSIFRTQDDMLATAPSVNENGELLVAGRRRLYCLK